MLAFAYYAWFVNQGGGSAGYSFQVQIPTSTNLVILCALAGTATTGEWGVAAIEQVIDGNGQTWPVAFPFLGVPTADFQNVESITFSLSTNGTGEYYGNYMIFTF